ncbi:sodium-dependent transporter [Campylobacter geochelonis]|uniref:Transporter n=1 Tax=Campylobacter geochelonis TaxID=1780362 RepID=A0A128EDP7_9BACT|nr:sodium-dependent transporter [Campylobacter geochelonis]QKF71872.1 sodium-dependent transporter, SNF family [Campylobacter geochelonis]CZE47056.1 sodium-dependent transporter [Campylobacter geochelonis]CZE47366.1 sodium-dependent transporter [Campylobacter geochelonis]CZE50978.1 sodium-dependent transporter [Campylobacter geochelonis]
MQRQTWSNKLTYILTVAGATIGFGCTWRFPYLVGENGGGAYVLVFCIAMIALGIPMILVENVIGRRAMKNSVDAFGVAKKDGTKINKAWKIVGYMGLVGSFGILAYYMVLGGWVMTYIANILMGNFDLSAKITDQAYTTAFYDNNIANNPLMVGLYTFIFVAINWYILKKGIIDGIEKYVKFLMPALFLCFLAIIANNLTLDGAAEGIKFYLSVDFSKITPKLLIDVLGQVFFALSLGFGVMITLSSFLNKDEKLFQTATITGVLNTVIAVLAGFMIFPTLFTAGLEPSSGPSLVFKSLPIAFSHMPFGNVIAVVFFLILLIAALTTSITIYQVIINVVEERFKISITKATNYTLGGIFLLGNIPCLLSDGVLSNVRILGRSVFDAFDFISANIFFVLTALLCSLYVGWVLKDDALAEITNEHTVDIKKAKAWLIYVKYILPVIILVVFLYGIKSI